MTSSLGVSGPCALSVCPADWGSTLPWEGPLGLVLAPWLRGSSALPCLQCPSSWKGNGGGWGAAWPPAGCFDAQEILFFCECISVSLWKLMQLWKATCLVMVQQHVSLQSEWQASGCPAAPRTWFMLGILHCFSFESAFLRPLFPADLFPGRFPG